jgi:hypothetical protein
MFSTRILPLANALGHILSYAKIYAIGADFVALFQSKRLNLDQARINGVQTVGNRHESR